MWLFGVASTCPRQREAWRVPPGRTHRTDPPRSNRAPERPGTDTGDEPAAERLDEVRRNGQLSDDDEGCCACWHASVHAEAAAVLGCSLNAVAIRPIASRPAPANSPRLHGRDRQVPADEQTDEGAPMTDEQHPANNDSDAANAWPATEDELLTVARPTRCRPRNSIVSDTSQLRWTASRRSP
ncbi:MAG: hypothetical protein R2705_10635 [Ilumatobacteraceae bacterium]